MLTWPGAFSYIKHVAAGGTSSFYRFRATTMSAAGAAFLTLGKSAAIGRDSLNGEGQGALF